MYVLISAYRNSILCARHKGKVDLVGQISKAERKNEGRRGNGMGNGEWRMRLRKKKVLVISEVQRGQNKIELGPTAGALAGMPKGRDSSKDSGDGFFNFKFLLPRCFSISLWLKDPLEDIALRMVATMPPPPPALATPTALNPPADWRGGVAKINANESE